MNYNLLIEKTLLIPINIRKKYSYCLSLLPYYYLLSKLLKRKEQGKKPFSEKFNYEKKINLLDETIQSTENELEQDNINFSFIAFSLKYIIEIAQEAEEEIKNKSFKQDFTNIKLYLMTLYVFLEQNKWYNLEVLWKITKSGKIEKNLSI